MTSDGQEPEGRAHGYGFAAAFSEALDGRGATLSWLREQLVLRGNPISLATLSYWRSGHRSPERPSSIDALPDIEELLHLPDGHLQRAVGPPTRGVPLLAPVVGLEVITESQPQIESALAELGLADWSNGLQEVLVHSSLDVDQHGRSQVMGSRALYRATREGIDRYAQVLSFQQPVPVRPRYRVMHGSVPGRVAERPAQGLFVVEMLLPRPLALGETVMVEQQIELPEGLDPEDRLSQLLLRRVSEVVLWVRFDPRWLPSHAERFSETAEDYRTVPVDPSAAAVHHVLRGFGPGKAGIRWRR